MADEDNQDRDLAGYPNEEELAKGYRASSAEAKRLAEENRRQQEMIAQMQAQMAVNPRQEVPNRTDPRGRLEELGIPVDAIDALVDQRANERIQQAFQPIARSFEARNTVLSQYPDYQEFEAKVAQYINSDPAMKRQYEEAFAAQPVVAMEWAFQKFGETQKRSHPKSTRERENGEAVHAAIPSARSGEGRRPESQNDAVREAFKRYQETGSSRDAQAYARARLKTVIKDEFLNQ